MKAQLFRAQLPSKGVGCTVLFVKLVWTIHLLSQESDTLISFSLFVKTYSCDYKCLNFFCVIHKTVGLHSKLAYDDIDKHWSKLVCICKLLVMYKNHKQKKQTCLSRNKIRLMRWPMWVLLSVKLFCMMT